MRTIKSAWTHALKDAKKKNKPVSIALNLGGYFYLFTGNGENCIPSAYAYIGTAFPDGTKKEA